MVYTPLASCDKLGICDKGEGISLVGKLVGYEGFRALTEQQRTTDPPQAEQLTKRQLALYS